jgi:NADH-quinone oxidoreductase subunit G
MDIAQIDNQQAIVVVGSNLRREVPIIAHRVRKAALNGARVSFINREEQLYYFEVAHSVSGPSTVDDLAAVAVAAAKGAKLPATVATLCKGVKPEDRHKAVAETLTEAERSLVILGLIAAREREFSAIRALACSIAELTGATLGFLSEGCNSAGAHLAGVLPHRQAGGRRRDATGLHAAEIPGADLDALLLFGAEPDRDMAAADAVANLEERGFVAAMTPFTSPVLERCADLLLPVGTFAETSGTFVNCEGRWQSFVGVASPVGEARPGWKVLRVLGNLLGAPGFEYLSSEEVRDEFRQQLGDVVPDNRYPGKAAIERAAEGAAPHLEELDVPMYEVDGVVRRSTPLQLTPEARRTQLREREEAA